MKYIKNRISYQNGLILKALVLLCIFILLLPREGKTSIVLKGGVQPAGEVWLTGIEIDGNDSDLRKYPLSGKWRWISNSIVYVPDETAKGDSLELLFSNAQSIKLISKTSHI